MKAAILLSTLALATAGISLAKDFSFDFKTIKAQDVMAFPGGYGTYGQIRLKKAGEFKESAAVSKHPLYGRLGDVSNSIAFRLDESKGDGKGYDRLLLDLNQNGDLTDEAPVKAVSARPLGQVSSSSREEALFGPIELPADKRLGSWRPTYYAQVYIYNRQLITKPREGQNIENYYFGTLRFKPGWYLETTVKLDGVKQKVGLVDGDANFRLGDAWKPRLYGTQGQAKSWYFTPADSFLVDQNGSGKFENDVFGNETAPYGPLIYFGNSPYKVAVSADAKTLSVEPWTEPLGEIALQPRGDQVRSVSLAWESAAEQWTLIEAGVIQGKAKVPPGRYRLYGSVLEGKAGRADSLMTSASQRAITNTVRVEPGQTAAIPCGAPLEIRVTAQRLRYPTILSTAAATQGQPLTVRINANVVGAGGEIYSAWGKGRDFTDDPPKPTFTITSKDGKKIASGNLEFG